MHVSPKNRPESIFLGNTPPFAAFFSYMWTAFYVPGGGERRGKGEKKGREKRREERGKTHSNSNHDGHHRSRDRSSVQKNEEKE